MTQKFLIKVYAQRKTHISAQKDIYSTFFKIVKIWKQLIDPSTGIYKNVWYVYNEILQHSQNERTRSISIKIYKHFLKVE